MGSEPNLFSSDADFFTNIVSVELYGPDFHVQLFRYLPGSFSIPYQIGHLDFLG